MEDFAKRDRVVERKEVMLFDESAFRETMVNSIVATIPFNRLGDKGVAEGATNDATGGSAPQVTPQKLEENSQVSASIPPSHAPSHAPSRVSRQHGV